MAEVLHVAEENAKGPDASLERVAGLMAEKSAPIRMRVSIQLWDGEDYVSWKGQVWRTEVADAVEARDVQQALESFFDLVAARGAATTKQLLENALGSDGQGEEKQSSGDPEQIPDPQTP